MIYFEKNWESEVKFQTYHKQNCFNVFQSANVGTKVINNSYFELSGALKK